MKAPFLPFRIAAFTLAITVLIGPSSQADIVECEELARLAGATYDAREAGMPAEEAIEAASSGPISASFQIFIASIYSLPSIKEGGPGREEVVATVRGNCEE